MTPAVLIFIIQSFCFQSQEWKTDCVLELLKNAPTGTNQYIA